MRSQIRNSPGMSSYFGGAYQGYGRYQWNVKFYEFQADHEMEAACLWALGDQIELIRWNGIAGQQAKGEARVSGNTRYGFSELATVVGRPVESRLDGRSGGWLVIDDELTDAELEAVDSHVKACMEGLPAFLKEERQFRADEERTAEREETERRDRLAADPRVASVLKTLADIAGAGFSLSIQGITFPIKQEE